MALAALTGLLAAPIESRAQEISPQAAGSYFGGLVREYFTLELTPLTSRLGPDTRHAGVSGQACLRIFTFHWPIAAWLVSDVVFSFTSLELAGGFFLGAGGFGFDFYIGAAPGLTLRLGSSRQFQIALATGVGGGLLHATSDRSGCEGDDGCHMDGRGLLLSPSLRLRYQSDGLLALGVGLRALVPVSESLYSDEYGTCLFLFFELGFSDWRFPPGPEPA